MHGRLSRSLGSRTRSIMATTCLGSIWSTGLQDRKDVPLQAAHDLPGSQRLIVFLSAALALPFGGALIGIRMGDAVVVGNRHVASPNADAAGSALRGAVRALLFRLRRFKEMTHSEPPASESAAVRNVLVGVDSDTV